MNRNGKIFEGATFIQKDAAMVSGEKFFNFFNRKSLKLALGIAAGIVGIMGNFYAVRHQVDIMRADITSESVKDIYAMGLTGLLDLMIVVFHLMNVRALTVMTTISAVMISIYANVHMFAEKTTGIMGDVMAFVIALIMAVLPIAVLTYLMHLTMEQYKNEFDRIYGERK